MKYDFIIKSGFVILITAIAIIVLSDFVQGSNLLETDDFTGTDGDPPDPGIWSVYNRDTNDYVRLEENTLRIHTVNGGVSRAISINELDVHNFTVLVDWRMETQTGRLADLRIYSNSSGTPKSWMGLYYDGDWHGWGFESRYLGNWKYTSTYNRNAVGGEWYAFNITCTYNSFNVTVVRKSTSTTIYQRTGLPIDPFIGAASIHIGVGTSQNSMQPRVNYDSYRFYDNDKRPNIGPIWLSEPQLNAVEDVPIIFDFSQNVSDPDGPFDKLTITSHSQYVTNISGLVVTFEFPNGVTEATVPLVLSDRWDQATGDVNFIIRPVNDPPDHDIKTVWVATEDIPITFDFTPNVWDIDNDTTELRLETADQYSTVSSLNLTVMFPEGVLDHDVMMVISDGLDSVEVVLSFTIKPVDDPPTISPLGVFTAIEDKDSMFNVTPFLDDIDSPIDDLQVMARSPNCTVVGQNVHFRYTQGGIDENVLLQVTDGTTMVEGLLVVHVEPRNDAPVVHTVSPRGFVEDQSKTIDLAPYIEDEDSPIDHLRLSCDHVAVVDITSFNITLLYTTWMPEHEVSFAVSDGFLSTEGSFLAQVQEMNDPPRILGIGEFTDPVIIVLDEGTSGDFPSMVVDEDDQNFKYSLSTTWSGVTVTTAGVINVIALKGDVGEFRANLTVEDLSGARDNLEFIIRVMNINDPPEVPIIIKPSNHTIVDQGMNVSFSVVVSDPDIMLGQVLTVTWLSNISGLFRTLTTEDELAFMKDDLPVGSHTITVHVTDGEHVREVWVELEVVEPYIPPPPKEDPPFYETTSGIGLMVLVVLAVVGVAALFLVTRSRREEVLEPLPEEDGVITMDVVDGSQRYEMTALGEELGKMADELEESKALEPTSAGLAHPTPLPLVELEEAEAPSPEVLAQRKHDKEVREVMSTLTQLPRGLPTDLWNMDMFQLAKEIVDGPKRTASDGTVLVQIKRTWYTADHTNPGSFLREWRGEDEGGMSNGGRAKKAKQLEERLLDGTISEETYQKLRRKYEGG